MRTAIIHRKINIFLVHACLICFLMAIAKERQQTLVRWNENMRMISDFGKGSTPRFCKKSKTVQFFLGSLLDSYENVVILSMFTVINV